MKRFRFRIIYIVDILLVAVMLLLDRITKQMAVSVLKDREQVSIIKGVLELFYLENRGAAFGILQDKKIFFIIVGVVFTAVIAAALIIFPSNRKYRLLRFSLCMISAGAIGNLIDRAIYKYVIDFIYIVYINFPIFNVADIYITVSTAILIFLFLFIYKEDDLNIKKIRHPKIHSSMLEPKTDPDNNTDHKN